MITKTNFKNLLIALGFSEKGSVISKKINGILIEADFKNEKLIYPKGIKIEGEFTTNFSSAENFVVLNVYIAYWNWAINRNSLRSNQNGN